MAKMKLPAFRQWFICHHPVPEIGHFLLPFYPNPLKEDDFGIGIIFAKIKG
jgi:hypothetical protein